MPLLVLALASTVAFAAEPTGNFTIGAGVARSSFQSDFAAQVNDAYQGSGFPVVDARLTSDRDTGWKVYAGWQFHRYIAVELGYLDFGSAKTHYEVSQLSGATATRDGHYRLSGVELSLLGMLPVSDRVSLFAKAGAFASKLEYSERGFDPSGLPTSFTAPDDNQVRFLYGLGGSFNFGTPLAFRIEWQRVHDIGQRFALTTTGNGEFDHVDLISANLQWRF